MNEALQFFLLLSACHFIGDFAFQNEWMVINKGKSWEVLFYHAATYTATFFLFAKIGYMPLLAILLTHIFIDALKARYKIIKDIWIDQFLHFEVIALVVIQNMGLR